MGEPAARTYTVTEITRLVRGVLEDEFSGVTVEGEISNFRPSSTGHLYFSLKDEEAVLSVVMFRNRLFGLGFQPADGMKVKASGNLSVYAKRGTYQLVCETLVKSGEGELLAMLEKRKAALAALGLFEEARKRPLPMFPSRVAVVTSPTGAAIRDILQVLRRRNAGLSLVILPAPVQGDEAAEVLARQVRRANEFRMADVIIVTRGGGSLEDLLPFYEESLVRAIAESEIPVISAVGHEIDFTLSDLAADVRAPTPSAAAEMVSASRLELASRVRSLESAVSQSFNNRLERVRLLLSRFSGEALERSFRQLLQPVLLALDGAREDLRRGMEERLVPARHRLALLAQTLRDASPLTILERGYAVVSRRATAEVVRSSTQVETDELLGIRLHQGTLVATVKEKDP
ncbi:MAG: exodeoxyribonuclease VII large subunit [Spirochaetales bacterium]|nr:exodeoxyribonuclease VII large subunit [Spirochaetales bacterium]